MLDSSSDPFPEWFKISLASAGGMTGSLLMFMAMTAMQAGTSLQGSLTGDGTGTQATTTDALASAVTSYGWWAGVIVVGVLLSGLFLFLSRKRA